MNIVLDAGALIGFERGDAKLWKMAKAEIAGGGQLIAPTTVVAQVWRGLKQQANLARILHQCELAPFDPFAKLVGELCGRAKTSDICDAHVALVAASSDAIVYTSDPDDIAHLLDLHGSDALVIRC